MDMIFDTLPPGTISEELAPVIQSLGLTRHCEEASYEWLDCDRGNGNCRV